MNKQIKSHVLLATLAVLVWLPPPALVAAQTLTGEVSRPPISTGTPPPPIPRSQITFIEQAASTPIESQVIHGLQGVLVETLDGKTVAAQSAEENFNPASAIKLATALVALKTFGPQHRFTTGIWTTGTFDKVTGTLHGNLYISGRDPSFNYENGVMIARQLNTLGIRTITGNLVVAPGFTMKFNWSARRSGEQLYDTLDSTIRSSEASRAWLYERTALGDQSSLQSVPSVAVMGEIDVNPVAADAKLVLSQKSSKLVDILKVLLCFSNNFMAERLGDSVGGMQSVRRQLISSLGLSPSEFMISSLSGLGVNRASPRTMMKIFRALREELRKNKLSTTDIMPVAGIDPGTLQERFTGSAWRGSVIAKTGTLIRTDGGVSALVGQMKTAGGETLLFVIMNRQGSVLRFRLNQDYLVMQIQNSRGGPKAFDYKPHLLAMKLADTQSLSSAGDEYEPVLKAPVTTP
ncbi:MAG: D-alanyl-D-alanine carboxypeptidase [Acidobacteriota bacterium]|nr:D-alanyl-D-alanine carboxypeptidase [Acidobacteriota bacterium]